MTIVTTHYRYKRPPRKKKAVALQVPTVVTPALVKQRPRGLVIRLGPKGEAAVNDNSDLPRPATIVAAKNPRQGRLGDVPDLTPEELQERREAAAALWRELIRRD
jgi:hypothetical protein